MALLALVHFSGYLGSPLNDLTSSRKSGFLMWLSQAVPQGATGSCYPPDSWGPGIRTHECLSYWPTQDQCSPWSTVWRRTLHPGWEELQSCLTKERCAGCYSGENKAHLTIYHTFPSLSLFPTLLAMCSWGHLWNKYLNWNIGIRVCFWENLNHESHSIMGGWFPT